MKLLCFVLIGTVLLVGCSLPDKLPLDYNTEFIPNRSEPGGTLQITNLKINETLSDVYITMKELTKELAGCREREGETFIKTMEWCSDELHSLHHKWERYCRS